MHGRRTVLTLLSVVLALLAQSAGAQVVFDDDFSTNPFDETTGTRRWCERFHHVHWIDDEQSPQYQSLIGMDGSCCLGIDQCGPCLPIAGVAGSCGTEACEGTSPVDPDLSDWPNCRHLLVSAADYGGETRAVRVAFGVPVQLSNNCDAACPGCPGEHLKVAAAAHPSCEASIEALVVTRSDDPTKQTLRIRSVTTPRAGFPECGTTPSEVLSTIEPSTTFELIPSSSPNYELAVAVYPHPTMPTTKLAAEAAVFEVATGQAVATAQLAEFPRPAWYNAQGQRFAIGGLYPPKSQGSVVYDNFQSATLTPDDLSDPSNPNSPNGAHATPLDPIVSTDVLTGSRFLYVPANPALPPLQTAYGNPAALIPPSTFEAKRVSVIRGRVLDDEEHGHPDVRVSILNHHEFGQTYTRSDGEFDLVVNGGGSLTVVYEHPDRIPVHRLVDVGWQSNVHAPDVVMLERHPAVPVTIGLASGPQVVQGLPIADDNPANPPRIATIIVPANTTITSPAGLNGTLNFRATEVTTKPGEAGKRRMPAALPPESGYTYAVEFGIDEAEALGADTVTFSQDLWTYVDNFLGFPVGEVVPAGYYDRVKGSWIPSVSGKVIEIVSVTGGLADVDTDGNSTPDNIGISNEERQALGALRTAQQIAASLWRVPVRHFSAWDYNWPIGPPDGSGPPAPSPPDGGDPDPSMGAGNGGAGGDPDGGGPADPAGPCEAGGSIIECQSQVLGERISLVGSPFTLNYRSNRVPGYLASRTLTYWVNSNPMPPGVKRILVETSIAGRTETHELPFDATGPYTFTWDGKDVYNRTVYGAHRLRLRIGYVYDGSYRRTTRFGYYGNGVPITGDPGRAEITIWKDLFRMLSNRDTRGLGLGGWSLDAHHSYDPSSRILFEGNGRVRSVAAIGRVVSLVGGNGGFTTGGGPIIGQPAITQPFDGSGPSDLTTMAASPDGNIYFNFFNAIRRVDPAGIVRSGAQNLYSFPDLAAGRDGSVYVADNGQARIFRIVNNLLHEHVAGNGGECIQTCQDPPDGALATQVPIWPLTNFAVGPDGTIYYLKSNRLRRINRDGTLGTVSGVGTNLADNIPAIEASLPNARHLAIGADGVIYVSTASSINNDGRRKLRRIGLDGRISTVAGISIGGVDQPCNLASAPCGDGGPAKDARISITNANVRLLSVGDDGSVYFVNEGSAIRRISPDGIITTVAGTIGVPASIKPTLGAVGQAALLRSITAIAIGRDGDLFILTNGQEGDNVTLNGNNRLLRLGPALESATEENGRILIPSTDGTELFEFNGLGRHERTFDSFLGVVKYTFAYDSAGLRDVTDSFGQVTHIERNELTASGSIAAPGDKTTLLEFDPHGYLAKVTNPSGEEHQFGYSVDGLLATASDSRPANPAAYLYDASGRLIADSHAGGGTTALSRSPLADGFLVDTQSPMGYFRTFRMQTLGGGTRRMTKTNSSAVTAVLDRKPSATETLTLPDGVIIEEKRAPDARFGMRAPFSGMTQFRMPGNSMYGSPAITTSLSRTRSVVLSSPLNPLSLSSTAAFKDVFTVAGSQFVLNYDATSDPAEPGLRRFTLVSPSGRVMRYSVDLNGRLREVANAAVHSLRFDYDDSNTHLLSRVRQGPSGGAERVVEYRYEDGHRRVTAVIDPMGNEMGFSYDDANRLTRVQYPNTATVGLQYEQGGSVGRVTTERSDTHVLAYDPNSGSSSYTAPQVDPPIASTETVRQFNLDGQLSTVVRPQAVAGAPPGTYMVTVAYDPASGRTSRIDLPGNHGVIRYSYEPATGKLSYVDGPSAALGASQRISYAYNGILPIRTEWGCSALPCAPSELVSGVVSREYDGALRIVGESVTGSSLGNPLLEDVSYGYDTDGLLSGMGVGGVSFEIHRAAPPSIGFATALMAGSVEENREYDDFGSPSDILATYSSTIAFSSHVDTRDKLNRIVAITEDDGQTSKALSYEYDTVGQLIGVQENGAPLVGYEYDLGGNRVIERDAAGSVVATATFDDQDRLVSRVAAGVVTSYSYTAAGELASKTLQTVPSALVTEYEYDALGALRRVTSPSGQVIDYVIDGFGRRVGKKVGSLTVTPTMVEMYLYDDQSRVIGILDSQGVLRKRFAYGTQASVPELMADDTGVYRIVGDHVGSVRLVVDVANGQVVQRIDYGPFGEPTLLAGMWNVQPFGFAGGLFDPETGLVRFGARDYDPSVGRWTSKDVIGFEGGGTNLYVYVGNDPVNRTDPSGLIYCPPLTPQCIAAGALGGAIGGAVGAILAGANAGEIKLEDVGKGIIYGLVAGAIGGAVGNPVGPILSAVASGAAARVANQDGATIVAAAVMSGAFANLAGLQNGGKAATLVGAYFGSTTGAAVAIAAQDAFDRLTGRKKTKRSGPQFSEGTGPEPPNPDVNPDANFGSDGSGSAGAAGGGSSGGGGGGGGSVSGPLFCSF